MEFSTALRMWQCCPMMKFDPTIFADRLRRLSQQVMAVAKQMSDRTLTKPRSGRTHYRRHCAPPGPTISQQQRCATLQPRNVTVTSNVIAIIRVQPRRRINGQKTNRNQMIFKLARLVPESQRVRGSLQRPKKIHVPEDRHAKKTAKSRAGAY